MKYRTTNPSNGEDPPILLWINSGPGEAAPTNKKPLWQERGVGQRVGSDVNIPMRADKDGFEFLWTERLDALSACSDALMIFHSDLML